jgi:ABC-2 type transport system permease protein
LIAKTVRETWLITLLFALGLFTFEGLLAYMLPLFDRQILDYWAQMPFLKGMFKALLGTEVGESIGPGMIASIAWIHPIVLIMIWAYGIIFCTRVPAGEVDRGTIDVLLGLPVSRTRVYVCESFVWLTSGLLIMAAGLGGNLIGNIVANANTQGSIGHVIIVLVNLYGLYLAVGSLALLASSWSDRRGRAVGITFAVVLVSYLLNFLAQFWQPARSIAFLSIQHYYRPLAIIREGAWPTSDVLVLVIVSVVFWSAGVIIFNRRDICTV